MFSIDLNRRIRSRMYGGVRGRRYSYLLLLDWTIIYIIFCIFAISLILAGCVCWITVLFARVNPNEFSNRGIKSDSLIFFSSIVKHKSLSSYKQKLEKCETVQMEEDLISQIYICSIICDKKFKYYKLGLLFASIGLIFFVVLFVIGLVI